MKKSYRYVLSAHT